jgi:hypothetical protein
LYSAIVAFSLCSVGNAQTLEKFDTLRLENEMTFDVPLEKGEEVWSWLTQTFGKGFQSNESGQFREDYAECFHKSGAAEHQST